MEDNQVEVLISYQPEALALGSSMKSDKTTPAQVPNEPTQKTSLGHPSSLSGVSGATPIGAQVGRAPAPSDTPAFPSFPDPWGLIEFEVLWSERHIRESAIAELFGVSVRTLHRASRDLGLAPRGARFGARPWTRPAADVRRVMRREVLGNRLSKGGRKLLAEADTRKARLEHDRRAQTALLGMKTLLKALARLQALPRA